MFYNLESDFSNGCNTCETVPQTTNPNQMNNGFNNNMQVNQGQQPFNPYALNGQQSSAPQVPTIPVVQNIPTQQQVVVQQNGQKVLLDSAAHQAATQYVNEPATNAPDFVNYVEGFGDGLMTESQFTRKMIIAVFIVITALAVNECMKYYLNKGVQSCEGTSYHYLSYSILAVLVVVVIVRMTRNM
jgi:hypothetical protein